MLIIKSKWITRQRVREGLKHGWVFLFGDNFHGIGLGGQAKEMRGEPNAFGIPTKKIPSMSDGAFFDDSELEFNKQIIWEAFDRIPRDAKAIVIPADGLGTGLAQLQTRAPKTWDYLNQCIDGLRFR